MRTAAFGVVRVAGERRELALVALVTVVGGYLRFSGLGRQSFWIDELVMFSYEWTPKGPRATDIHLEQTP